MESNKYFGLKTKTILEMRFVPDLKYEIGFKFKCKMHHVYMIHVGCRDTMSFQHIYC